MTAIAATLTAEDAAAARYDAIVVGAGPAGALLARRVAELGGHVLLVDRSEFPRPKVCGGCLSARTVAHLQSMGLGGELDRRGGPPLRRLRLAGWQRGVTLGLPGGMAISRRTLDAMLLRAAIDKGVDFLPRWRAALGPVCGDVRQLELHDGARGVTVRGAVVVDAAGLGSALVDPGAGRRAAGTQRVGCSAVVDDDGSAYEPGTIYMAVGDGGYVGAARLEDGRLNVAAALDHTGMQRRGAADSVRLVLQQAGFPPLADAAETSWSGTPPLWQQPRRRAAPRLIAVGDAAGYVEPFTGEGIGWALRSAELAAPLVAGAATRRPGDLVASWNATYRRELARRQRGCRALARLLRHPTAARCALHLLRLRPALGALFVRRLHAPDLAQGSAV